MSAFIEGFYFCVPDFRPDITEHSQLEPLFAPYDSNRMCVEHLPKVAKA